MNELFFTVSLTKNEHYIVEDMIRRFCETNNLEVKYYRKFKTGHVPMERECKILGAPKNLSAFKEYMVYERIPLENYHRDNK